MLIIKTLNILKDQRDIILSINITYSDLIDKKLITIMTDMMNSYDIGNRLIFEIVESEDIKNYEILKKFVEKFRKYGVKIAIDDFGSGFSNFEHIIKIKPDYIKIDGSLIKNIDKDLDTQSIVKAITQIADELDVKLIAEFVHSKEVLDLLHNYKIDEYQGYYFYEPSPFFIKDKDMV
jgi:EAL domain-containing protein (putative c-di-GMP-specific phosphodiesterase class I)